MGVLVTLLSALPCFGEPLKTASARLRMDGRQVMIWYPTEVKRALPLVLFSHGYRGANIQSRSLMRSIAAAGYLVIAPNHNDSAVWLGGEGKASFQASFDDPESWTDATYRDRYEDILAVYRSIPNEPKVAQLYDNGPVILIGHSLGGYTTLGMAGARPAWASEIAPVGVIALSPFSAPYLGSGALQDLKVPVMYQGGTRDYLTAGVARPGGAYDQTPTDRYFINFEGAGHTAWTDLSSDFQPQIAQYVIAFCDRYAKQSGPVLTKKLPGVKELRHSNSAGAGASLSKPLAADGD